MLVRKNVECTDGFFCGFTADFLCESQHSVLRDSLVRNVDSPPAPHEAVFLCGTHHDVIFAMSSRVVSSLRVVLPLPPECWDYRHVPPFPAQGLDSYASLTKYFSFLKYDLLLSRIKFTVFLFLNVCYVLFSHFLF